MEGHAVAGPEGDQGAELVAELSDGPDEAAAEFGGGAFGYVEG